MPETRKLVYDLKRKLGLLDTDGDERMPLVDLIAYLNEFQQIAFNNLVKDAERNQQVANEIRKFKKDRVSLTLKQNDKSVLAIYPSDIHTRLNQVAVVEKPECCDDPKELVVKIVQSDDLQPARKNVFQKSSFYFERSIAVISADGLLIYHDDEYDVKEVFIDYYRKPEELHAPSLAICDGPVYYLYNGQAITKDTYCEFENFADNFITDGAAILATADRKQTEAFNLQIQKFIQSRGITPTSD